MAATLAELNDELRDFIQAQRIFFVATAPLNGDGHVNLSPKGMDSFRVLAPQEVAYLDYVGSGAETIAHLRENGRIVIMFCAFEGPPSIVRLHGKGTVIEPQDTAYRDLRSPFPPDSSGRAVIRVTLDRVATSCGYGVPAFAYVGDRPQLKAWADRKGRQGLVAYQTEHNACSIDGLPALRWTEAPSKSHRRG